MEESDSVSNSELLSEGEEDQSVISEDSCESSQSNHHFDQVSKHDPLSNSDQKVVKEDTKE